MAAGSKNTGKNKQLVKGAHQALDDMKYEIAREFNLPGHQGSEGETYFFKSSTSL